MTNQYKCPGTIKLYDKLSGGKALSEFKGKNCINFKDGKCSYGVCQFNCNLKTDFNKSGIDAKESSGKKWVCSNQDAIQIFRKAGLRLLRNKDDAVYDLYFFETDFNSRSKEDPTYKVQVKTVRPLDAIKLFIMDKFQQDDKLRWINWGVMTNYAFSKDSWGICFIDKLNSVQRDRMDWLLADIKHYCRI